jgi:hypothetical protein
MGIWQPSCYLQISTRSWKINILISLFEHLFIGPVRAALLGRHA